MGWVRRIVNYIKECVVRGIRAVANTILDVKKQITDKVEVIKSMSPVERTRAVMSLGAYNLFAFAVSYIQSFVFGKSSVTVDIFEMLRGFSAIRLSSKGDGFSFSWRDTKVRLFNPFDYIGVEAAHRLVKGVSKWADKKVAALLG